MRSDRFARFSNEFVLSTAHLAKFTATKLRPEFISVSFSVPYAKNAFQNPRPAPVLSESYLRAFPSPRANMAR